jgi:hypothetical protein
LVKYFALWLAAITGCLMLFGFFKPWIVLWWEPVQTRRRVIRLYGTICLVALIVYAISRAAR